MISIDKISKVINGEVLGDKSFRVSGICDIEKGKNNCISYLSNNKYKKYLKTNIASVIIVDKNFKVEDKDKIYVKVSNPSVSFIKVINLFYPKTNRSSKIDSSANIDSKVKIGNNVFIGPYVTIEKNVIIKDNVIIHSGSFVGENTSIDSNTEIFSNVSIYNNCKIGEKCKIDSGTVIGTDGFGLAKDKAINKSIPHIGRVIIKNDVYIGANCCIDRGTINDTVIDDNCRLDNLIQIAHNVKIGKGCIIAGQVGIAGSVILDDYVTISGQAAVADHVSIGENSVITAKSFVCNSTGKNSFLSGNPAQPHRSFLKQQIMLRNLETKSI